MQIYSANQKGPLKMTGYIDPDDTTKITVFWNADTWLQNTVYYLGDICKPTINNGYYYQCTTAGKSSSTEPNWNNDTTLSNTAEFTAIPWDLWLKPTEILTNSTWSISDNITISDQTNTGISTTIFINPFANTILEFEITNQVTKSNGETLSRSFKYKTNQQ